MKTANMERKIRLGDDIQEAIQINILAYNLEKLNPHLDFFEINKLVLKQIQKPKLKLVK